MRFHQVVLRAVRSASRASSSRFCATGRLSWAGAVRNAPGMGVELDAAAARRRSGLARGGVRSWGGGEYGTGRAAADDERGEGSGDQGEDASSVHVWISVSGGAGCSGPVMPGCATWGVGGRGRLTPFGRTAHGWVEMHTSWRAPMRVGHLPGNVRAAWSL